MNLSFTWIRRLGSVALMVGAIWLFVPSGVSRAGTTSSSFSSSFASFGTFTLFGGQSFSIDLSFRGDSCRFCTSTEIEIWDAATDTLLASSSTAAGAPSASLEISRGVGEEPLEVYALAEILDSPRPASASASTYRTTTRQTESLNSRAFWVDATTRRTDKRRRVLQSCPVGLAQGQMVVVTLVNRENQPMEAQLEILDPDRDVLAQLPSSGEGAATILPRSSKSLTLDGDEVLLTNERLDVVAVLTTRRRDTLPLVSIQLVDKARLEPPRTPVRTIVIGNNQRLIEADRTRNRQ